MLENYLYMADDESPSNANQTPPDAARFWTRSHLLADSNRQSANESGPEQPRKNYTSIARRALAAYRPLSLKVLRVSQLDAELLDAELTNMMKEQFLSIFSLFKVRLQFLRSEERGHGSHL